ncbi:hypothetical protein JCM11641_007169 [Rhodosporidiobolus odoratus]
MDLEALRKAALQTKKRKRTQPTLEPDEDKEEGEIDDDLLQPQQAVTQPVPSTVVAQPSPERPPPPLGQPGAASSLSPQALHAIKEESKAIIAELLTYGVPPDYLLAIGVSRDILEISFHELNLALTLPPPSPPLLAPTALPAGSLSTEETGLVLSPISFAATLTSASNVPSQPAVPDAAALASLEARKRAELLARKAALTARNQQRAQSLESELDNLFASTLPASSAGPGSQETGSLTALTARKRPRLRSPASATHLHALRESLDQADETVDLPDAGPFASSATTGGADSVAQSSVRVNGAGAPPARRPVAVDFEGEPTVKMSLEALSAQRGPGIGPAYIPRDEPSMIIELSDDEDEEDRDVTQGRMEIDTRGLSPMTQQPSLLSPSDPAEQARKRQLEEKDRELQRLKERIAAFERRKKEGKARMESVEPVSSSTAHLDGSPVLESDGVSTNRPAAQDHPSLVVVVDKSVIDGHEVFRPYESSLSRFPMSRAKALASTGNPNPFAKNGNTHDHITANSQSLRADIANTLTSAGVASWAAVKHGVNTSKRLCKAETGGGKCLDTKCKSVHARDFVPTEGELAEYQCLQTPSASSSATSNSSTAV